MTNTHTKATVTLERVRDRFLAAFQVIVWGRVVVYIDDDALVEAVRRWIEKKSASGMQKFLKNPSEGKKGT